MKYLLDSNIIIYAGLPDFAKQIGIFTSGKYLFVSQISIPEVLGFTQISQEEIDFFNSFFTEVSFLQVTQEILYEAATLRQQKKLSLGDAIIAATASIHQLTLVTANTKDFKKLQGGVANLDLINPLEV